jgi:hypothetical protein
VPTNPINGRVNFESRPELIRSDRNTLFTSGTLGRFSNMLNSVIESPGQLYADPHKRIGIRDGSVQVETRIEDR